MKPAPRSAAAITVPCRLSPRPWTIARTSAPLEEYALDLRPGGVSCCKDKRLKRNSLGAKGGARIGATYLPAIIGIGWFIELVRLRRSIGEFSISVRLFGLLIILRQWAVVVSFFQGIVELLLIEARFIEGVTPTPVR